MFKSSLILPSLVTLALLSVSCSTISVRTDSDPQVNFITYRSFALLERPTADPGNSLHRNPPAMLSVEESITNELTLLGLKKVNRTEADMLVAYHGGNRDKVNVQRWGYSYGPRKWYGEHELSEREYDEETLIIDIVDARSKQLVWRGWGSGVITSPENTRKRASQAVEKILEKFPPEK